jgi:hypothetical protein
MDIIPTDTKLVSLTKADFGFQGIGLTYEFLKNTE